MDQDGHKMDQDGHKMDQDGHKWTRMLQSYTIHINTFQRKDLILSKNLKIITMTMREVLQVTWLFFREQILAL
jgi:hypothetical protein